MLGAVAGIKLEIGRVLTPTGEEINGFRVSIGHTTDPSEISRTYEDIERIFKSNEINFKTHEEHRENGTFKSYTVSTN